MPDLYIDCLCDAVVSLVGAKLSQDVSSGAWFSPSAFNRELKSLWVNAGRRAGHTRTALHLFGEVGRTYPVLLCVRNHPARRRMNTRLYGDRSYALSSKDDREGLGAKCDPNTVIIVDDASHCDTEWLLNALSPRLFVFLG